MSPDTPTRAKHIMRRHWGKVVNGLVVTESSPKHSILQTNRRKCYFTLMAISRSYPPPTTTPPWTIQSAGARSLLCFMSKPIVQLKELFPYIAGGQWTSHLCVIARTFSRPPTPTLAISSPAPTHSRPPGQGAIRSVAHLLLWPHWAGVPCGLGWPSSAANVG